MGKRDEYGLNPKQRAFADEYLLNGNNAAAAYRHAYNPKATDKVSATRGNQLLNETLINLYIAERKKKAVERFEISQQEMEDTLMRMYWEIATGIRVETDVVEQSSKHGTRQKSMSRQWAMDRLTSILDMEKKPVQNNNTIINVQSNGTATMLEDVSNDL